MKNSEHAHKDMSYLLNLSNKELLIFPNTFLFIVPFFILISSFFVPESYFGFFKNNIESVIPNKSKWISDVIQFLLISTLSISFIRFILLINSKKLKFMVKIFLENERYQDDKITNYSLYLICFIVLYIFLLNYIFDTPSYSPTQERTFFSIHQITFIYAALKIMGFYFILYLQFIIFLFIGVKLYEHEMQY